MPSLFDLNSSLYPRAKSRYPADLIHGELPASTPFQCPPRRLHSRHRPRCRLSCAGHSRSATGHGRRPHLLQFHNIVDSLIGSGDFGKLGEILSSSDPSMFPLSATLFVPSDSAFSSFSNGLRSAAPASPHPPSHWTPPLLLPHHPPAPLLLRPPALPDQLPTPDSPDQQVHPHHQLLTIQLCTQWITSHSAQSLLHCHGLDLRHQGHP